MSLDAIGIVSADTAQSQLFYGFLGVDLTEQSGEGHYEGTTPSGVRIMLDSVELTQKFNPDWSPKPGNGLVLAFKQESPSVVNQLYDQITAAGFTGLRAPWDAFWGQRYACLLDPDGNQIDIFSNL